MLRHELTFDFSAEDLLAATRRKIMFHRERQEHWKAAAAEAEQKLREEGIDFREVALAGGTYSASNKLRGMEATFDQTLLKNFYEAQAKVEEHTKRILEYESFEVSFAALVERGQGGKSFNLHADDVFWFGLS